MHLLIVSLTEVLGGKRLGVDSSFFNWCLIRLFISISWHGCGVGVGRVAASDMVTDNSFDFLFGFELMFLPCK